MFRKLSLWSCLLASEPLLIFKEVKIMKKIVLCFAILLMRYAFVNAACTSPCAFQQPWYMTSAVKDAGPWTNGTTQNFWCLSDPSGANDQGTGANWWVLYTPTVWQINGNWGNGGVDGCCGMAAEGFGL